MKKAAAVCIFLVLVFPLFAADSSSAILKKAETLVGVPYRYGGITPAGFDCSGFITYLFKPLIPQLPRISRDMARYGTRVSREQLRPGDLVFFATGKYRNVITHVALYMGNSTIIHAVSGGPETGVIITNLETRYWKNRYAGAVRILKETTHALPQERLSAKAQEVKKPSLSSSPWNTFDGVLEGDFNLYKKQEHDTFEAWKKRNDFLRRNK